MLLEHQLLEARGALEALAQQVHGALEQWLASPEDTEAFCHAEDLAEALVRPFATGATIDEAAPLEAGRDLVPPF